MPVDAKTLYPATGRRMAASLLRKGTYNSRDIKFELEATIVIFEVSYS